MSTRTTTRLLDDLRDPGNSDAWRNFDARYRPVLVSFARRLGFQPDDAVELAQQTLVEFARAYLAGRYQRAQGRLSSWLVGIARHVGSAMRRTRGAQRVGGDTMIAELPAENDLSRVWEDERDRSILQQALAQLRTASRADESTFLAFELCALRGVPAQEVANRCGISVDSVYLAKSRLTKRLREIVAEMTEVYEEC